MSDSGNSCVTCETCLPRLCVTKDENGRVTALSFWRTPEESVEVPLCGSGSGVQDIIGGENCADAVGIELNQTYHALAGQDAGGHWLDLTGIAAGTYKIEWELDSQVPDSEIEIAVYNDDCTQSTPLLFCECNRLLGSGCCEFTYTSGPLKLDISNSTEKNGVTFTISAGSC